jgi:hypothetical protein
VSTDERETASRSAQGWVLVLASVGSIMVAFDTLVVSTALTTIRVDLGASIEELEWTVNAFNLSLGEAPDLQAFLHDVGTIRSYGRQCRGGGMPVGRRPGPPCPQYLLLRSGLAN